MSDLVLRFPAPGGRGWVRFSREIDGVQRDLKAMGRQMTEGRWRPTQQNIDRIIEILLLFVPATTPEEKDAARETILDFSQSELNEAIAQLGQILAEGRRTVDDYTQQELAKAAHGGAQGEPTELVEMLDTGAGAGSSGDAGDGDTSGDDSAD